MGFDGNGNYTRTNGTQTGSTLWQDRAAIAPATISASEHDAEMNDVATALTACLKADGSKTATNNQPMGGFKHTGVADATLANQYATLGQVQTGLTVNDLIVSANNTGSALRVTQIGTGEALRVEDSANPDSTPFVVTGAGDVGIGTASPSVKLQVEGQGLFNVNTSTDAVRITQTGTGNAFVVEDSANPDTTPFVIANNGKVGIGITNPGGLPSSLYVNGEIGSTDVTTNTLVATATIKSAGTLVCVEHVGGDFSALPNASATTGVLRGSNSDGSTSNAGGGTLVIAGGKATGNAAGGPIVFQTSVPTVSGITVQSLAERMRVTSGGFVGIGTSTPDRSLVVDSASNPLSAGEASLLVTGSANKERIAVRHYGTGDPVFIGQRYLGTSSVPTAVTVDQSLCGLAGQGYNGTALSSSAALVGLFAAETFTPTGQGTYAQIETTPVGSTTRAVRVRVSPSGNVGIGTTSPSYPVDVVAESSGAVGTQIRGRSSDNIGILRFSANNGTTEQARIQSNSTSLEIIQTGNNPIVFTQNGTARFGIEALSMDVKNQGIKYTGLSVGSGTANNIGFKWSSPNLIGVIDNSATVQIANVSDYRLKDQFTPLDPVDSLAKVKKLNPGSYFPKDLDGSVAFDRPQIGLIAHEVAAIAPSVVLGTKDELSSEGKPVYQSVHYAGLVPLLIGAIKTLSDKVEALEAEVSALKGA